MVNDGEMTLSNVIKLALIIPMKIPLYHHEISLLSWAPWDDYGIIMA